MAPHAKEIEIAVEPEPKLEIATPPSKIDKTMATPNKVPAVPVETIEKVLPVKTNENENASGNDTPKNEQDSPNLVPKEQEHTEDLKGDRIQNQNDQVDLDDDPPQTEDNDGQEHDQFDGFFPLCTIVISIKALCDCLIPPFFFFFRR